MTDNTNQKTDVATVCVEQIVMWGKYEVADFSIDGPNLSTWDFIPDPPWICCPDNGLKVVVPLSDFVDGGWEFVEVGISFVEMIEAYKETFLSDPNDVPEELEKEKDRAIDALEKAIAIIKGT